MKWTRCNPTEQLASAASHIAFSVGELLTPSLHALKIYLFADKRIS